MKDSMIRRLSYLSLALVLCTGASWAQQSGSAEEGEKSEQSEKAGKSEKAKEAAKSAESENEEKSAKAGKSKKAEKAGDEEKKAEAGKAEKAEKTAESKKAEKEEAGEAKKAEAEKAEAKKAQAEKTEKAEKAEAGKSEKAGKAEEREEEEKEQRAKAEEAEEEEAEETERAAQPINQRIIAQVQARRPNPLRVEERRALSTAASRILTHTARARDGIAQKNAKEARRNVKQGLTLVGVIEEAVPPNEVEIVIRSRGTVYEATDQVKPTIVPMYSDAATVSLLTPIEAAQKKSGKLKGDPSVRDVELRYTRIEMDLEVARRQLEAAQQALQKGELKQADQALGAIQNSVVLEFVEQDLPLLEARRNLMMGQKLLAQGDQDAARKAIRAAAGSLQKYSRRYTGEFAEKMAEVASHINSYLNRKDELDSAKIDRWWDEIAHRES